MMHTNNINKNGEATIHKPKAIYNCQMSVGILPGTRTRLIEISGNRGISMSELIREYLDDSIERFDANI